MPEQPIPSYSRTDSLAWCATLRRRPGRAACVLELRLQHPEVPDAALPMVARLAVSFLVRRPWSQSVQGSRVCRSHAWQVKRPWHTSCTLRAACSTTNAA